MSAESTKGDMQEADRPLECSECKKPPHVCYTELQHPSSSIHKVIMCNDCPVLKRKLHGQGSTLGETTVSCETAKKMSSIPQDGSTCLCCGGCGLSQDEIRMGSLLGCPLCYEIFYEDIIDELVALEKIPTKTAHIRKSGSLHTGRRPNSAHEGDLSFKLVALHEALHETLGREDYEQAAWLRDQIKQLTEQKENQTNSNG